MRLAELDLASVTKALSRVEVRGDDECWPCSGYQTWGGYAHGWVRKATGGGVWIGIHRVALLLKNEELDDSLCVLHHCDNRPCCNPKHLYEGTHKKNAEDRDSRGRRVPPRGESHKSSKLSLEQVMAIKADERTQQKIAEEYGICQANVSLIKRGRTWKA